MGTKLRKEVTEGGSVTGWSVKKCLAGIFSDQARQRGGDYAGNYIYEKPITVL
ncbi:hypothetical protein OOZ15_05360 [Galbibacter sp. EGI 63066]|uniref:hypothetical protein n=1 Tax=Galbibacter sp. EGI 63066 TaxID=2993559 RepID=UPI002248FE27|nr:hypothetical protein [Galbibacter sp. EGI 63066]MCX2679364.1 hypothetical protein [Galbibacter sp. EGI 63066]